MTLEQFLTWLLTAAGAGAFTWGVIALAEQLAGPLPSALKFYGAFVIAWAVPLAAYGAEVYLEFVQPSLDGLFAAVAVGYFVSQTVHRQTGK